MHFTEKEIAYLLDKHTVETATGERRLTNYSQDLRSLGCPSVIFERILRHRANQLGRRFLEFRMANRSAEVEAPRNTDSLELEIESQKLF
jgi:hypothetical protein